MKKSTLPLTIIVLLLIFTFFPTNYVLSQQNEGSYFVVQYHSVHPTMESQYYELETNVWKKMHEARISADLLDGWYMFRVISPVGTKTEYNYVVILEYDNAEKLAGHFEEYGVDYTAILSAEEIAMALKTPEIRDQVYEEVWRTLDTEMKQNTDKMYRFQVFNAMKLNEGTTADEYQKIENDYWKPIHKARIVSDKMYGWGIYNMIIPGGTERAYTWATVDYYDRFIDYMAGMGDVFNKIHGPKNAAKYAEETDSKRDLLRTEVRELLDFLRDSDSGS